MSKKIVPHNKLHRLCMAKFIGAGVKEEDARTIADVLVHANLRGVDSHGVLRTSHYMERLEAGGLNPSPSIKTTQKTPVVAHIDGDGGFGHVVSVKAMDIACELAEKNGIGVIGVTNSSHCGALSYYVQKAANRGYIGMAVTQADKIVVPFGGSQPFFGTNPLAFGFPVKNSEPVIVDMATSHVALGKVLNARANGQNIPDDWGVDENGVPTEDPEHVNALLPSGGPKGSALAMIIDIFSGILMGGAFGPHITKMYGDYDQYRQLGQFFCVMRGDLFISQDEFETGMNQLVEDLHAQIPGQGFDQVFVPGEPEQLKARERKENGIPLPESVYQFLSQ